MNKFSVVADGKQLDTYDNIAVSFNYQIEDILDITKRTTNYSKTITLPGTPFNNKFFKQIFDVNIDTITFNVKKSIPASINIGEQSVMTGVLQLLNIIVNQDAVDYEVVVMGQFKNILNEFGELTLRNIDMSEYNHIRSKATIQSSWVYDVYKNGSLINNSAGGDGYVYPYIVYGNNQDIAYRMYASDLFPAVYLKTIVDKMFDIAGYTYTSKFFNSDYYKKLILPFVDDKLQMTDTEINNRTVAVGVNDTLPETANPLLYEPGVENTSVTGYRAISPVMMDNVPAWYQSKYWASNKGYWFPFEKETGSILDITLQDINNEWTYSAQTTPYTTANAVYPHTYARYKCQKSGYYNIDLTGNMIVKYWDLGGVSTNIELNSGDLKYYVKLIRKRGASEVILTDTGTLTFQPSQVFGYSPAYDNDLPLTLNSSASNVYLEVNDLVYIEFGFSMFQTEWAGNDDNIRAQALLLPSKDGVPSALRISPSNNNLVGGDNPINMNQILPDIKLKDLFLSVIKMFNLVVFDNPENPYNLIIEPRDDFYASRQRVVDWTYKLDYNNNVKITPMSELDVKTFLYTYREDGDYYNQEYKNEVKRIYGDYEIDVENDFSNVQNKLELIFSPTPDGQYAIGDRVAPLFCTMEDNILKPKKLKPRILFYGGLKSTNYPMIFKDTYDSATGVTVYNYAYCGMWDDPEQPQHDLGFGTTSKVYWNGINYYPTNTLVEQFHKNTLLDIIDINSRLLEADFHLTPQDIADLDFRDIILIDNAYWRINKVKNYNPIGTDKTTPVVLYKINNINIFAPDRVEISLSNKSCPSDVIKKFSIQGAYYISASGQILDANCCSSLNGDFIGGKCWVRTRLDGQIGVTDGFLKTSNTVIQGGTNITPNQQDRPEALMAGNNTINSPGGIVRGQSNYVDFNVKSVEILGDGNSITDGTKSAQIMGNGNSISNGTTNAFIFGDNNTIELDLSNTGSTATTLSNIFLIGNNVVASSGNTLYTDNIYMSSGSTFNGFPISGVTNPTLSQVLTNGNTTGANWIDVDSGYGLQGIDIPSTITDTISIDPSGAATGIKSENITTGEKSYSTYNPSYYETVLDSISINDRRDFITLDTQGYGNETGIKSENILTTNLTGILFNPDNSSMYASDNVNTIYDTISIDPQGLGNGTGIKSENTTTGIYSQTTHTPTDIILVSVDGAGETSQIIIANGAGQGVEIQTGDANNYSTIYITSLYTTLALNDIPNNQVDTLVLDTGYTGIKSEDTLSGNISSSIYTPNGITSQANDVASTITDTITLDPQGLGNGTGIKSENTTTGEFSHIQITPSYIQNVVSDGTDTSTLSITKDDITLNPSNGIFLSTIGSATPIMNLGLSSTGQVVTGTTGGATEDLATTLAAGNTTGTNDIVISTTQKIDSYGGLSSIEMDKLGTEGVFAIATNVTGDYSKLTLNQSSADATIEAANISGDYSNHLFTPVYQEMKVFDGVTSEQTIINIQPLQYQIGVYGLTSATSFLQSEDKIQLFADDTTSSYLQLNKRIIKSSDIQTNDATPVNIITIPTISNGMLSIKASIVGLKTDYTKGYGSELYGVFKNNGGTVTQIGTTDLIEKSDFTTATSTIDFSGTNIRVRVTGEALTDINWSVQIEIINSL
jgi:hypothetical protein